MKAVLSYLIVLASACSYMILFDRNAGGIMTVFLIVVPLVSVFLTLFSRKRVKLEVETSEELYEKNKPCMVKVHAFKKTILPLPIISFEFRATEHFKKPEYDIYRFSMSENKEMTLDIELLPEVCGNAGVTVRRVYITDYLGVFRFRMNLPDAVCRIRIVPEIHEITDCSDILRSISATLPDNDDDESETAEVFGKATFPGYGYRNYVPGDSLKKVNWKLSSKKQELFVRMDESSGMTLPKIILDLDPTDINMKKRSGIYLTGQLIEGALSVLDMCVRNGIECSFIYQRSGAFYSEDVVSSEDVRRIASEMLKDFTPEKIRIDLGSDPDSKSSDVNIVCAFGVYDDLADEAAKSVLGGNYVKVVMPESQFNSDNVQNVPELWLLHENWSLTRAF